MDDRTFGNPHHEVRVIQALQKPLHRHLFWLLEGYPAYGGSIRSFPMVQISQNNHLGCIKPCTSSDMCIYLPYQLVSRISGASTVSRRYPVVCFKSKVLKWTLQKIDEFLIWNPPKVQWQHQCRNTSNNFMRKFGLSPLCVSFEHLK